MKLPAVNCPNCNSVQKFALHTRDVGDMKETYIRCQMCRVEIIIGNGKPTRKHTHRLLRSLPQVR